MKHPHYAQCITASFLITGISLIVAARGDGFLAQLSDQMPPTWPTVEQMQGATTTGEETLPPSDGTWTQPATSDFYQETPVSSEGMPAPIIMDQAFAPPVITAADDTTQQLLLMGMGLILGGFVIHTITVLWHRHKDSKKKRSTRAIAMMSLAQMKM